MLVTEVRRNVGAFSEQEMMIIERDISYYQICDRLKNSLNPRNMY